MNSKAIRKQLLAAVAMVLVAAVALGSSTYAWFAANTRVTATGMQVNATTSSSLVIATKLNVANQTTVPMNSSTNDLIPVTHDNTQVAKNQSIEALGSSTEKTGLVYNKNPENVSSSTGYANSSTALTFEKAANSDSLKYYEDFVVYIASAGSQMENKKLQAYLYTGAAIGTAEDAKDTTKATSVDFYISSDSKNLGLFAGTLNLSTLDSTGKDGVTYTTADLDIPISDNIIPQNNSASDYIQITMRVYYDGALQKSESSLAQASGKAQAGVTYYDQYGNVQNVTANETDVSSMYTGTPAQAYVYSDKVTTTGTAFNVSFKAVEAS